MVVDHYHPSFNPFLDAKMLINISEKVQFQVRHFKSSLPRQTRESVIMSRIKTMMLEAHVSNIYQTRQLVNARRLTDRSCDNLRGLSCWSG